MCDAGVMLSHDSRNVEKNLVIKCTIKTVQSKVFKLYFFQS